MVNRIVGGNNVVPAFHHDSIHLVHRLKGTTEIRNSKLIVEMRVRSKEGLCHKDLMLGVAGRGAGVDRKHYHNSPSRHSADMGKVRSRGGVLGNDKIMICRSGVESR